MGKTRRGRGVGKGETTIQREALPDILSPSDQAGPARQDRRDIEGAGGSSLFDQTPSRESVRGGSQGVGNQTWVACRAQIRELRDQLVPATKDAFETVSGHP